MTQQGTSRQNGKRRVPPANPGCCLGEESLRRPVEPVRHERRDGDTCKRRGQRRRGRKEVERQRCSGNHGRAAAREAGSGVRRLRGVCRLIPTGVIWTRGCGMMVFGRSAGRSACRMIGFARRSHPLDRVRIRRAKLHRDCGVDAQRQRKDQDKCDQRTGFRVHVSETGTTGQSSSPLLRKRFPGRRQAPRAASAASWMTVVEADGRGWGRSRDRRPAARGCRCHEVFGDRRPVHTT